MRTRPHSSHTGRASEPKLWRVTGTVSSETSNQTGEESMWTAWLCNDGHTYHQVGTFRTIEKARAWMDSYFGTLLGCPAEFRWEAPDGEHGWLDWEDGSE